MANNKVLALGLGALTGAVGMIAMIRLVSGAFDAGMTVFAWAAILVTMIPWVGYSAWRAQHGRLLGRRAVAVLVPTLVGLVAVWFLTIGPVVALACSLAAFAVIWVSDWPARRPRGEETFVRIEELNAEDSAVVDEPQAAEGLDLVQDSPYDESLAGAQESSGDERD